MRAFLSFFAKAIMVVFISSCHNSSVLPTTPGTWDKLSDFAGAPRGNAVGFVIDDIAYVGTGYNFDGNQQLKDFWKYNKGTGAWAPVADFPGSPRSSSVAFALNGKGYVGLGYTGTNPLSDFYQYDPNQNTWTRIADFGTSPSVSTSLPRFGAIGFSVNGKAFVGSGSENIFDPLQALGDFWRYDDVQNQWIKIGDIGLARRNGWVMVIGEQAYLGGGTRNGVTLTDLWQFDSSTTIPWTNLEKSGVQPPGRELATTFSAGNYGYLVFGSKDAIPFVDAWQYSPPPLNKWSPIKYTVTNMGSTEVGMVPRASAVGFRIGDTAYVTTGKNGNRCFDDAWIFKP